jgi:hypothetical protein
MDTYRLAVAARILSGLVEPPTEPILLQSSISESYKKTIVGGIRGWFRTTDLVF